ncbi:MAG: hypothetical protein QOF26_1152 [Baekduia sp.]|nr:hypothetical protein [Baekduia sp.]
MKLRRLLRGAPQAPEAIEPRRRRRPRADGPRTIVPVDEAPAPRGPAPGTVFALDVDAARERLRRAIPPVGDDEQ